MRSKPATSKATSAASISGPAEAEMVVDLDRVVANWRLLSALPGAKECAGIVKGDAYGHGMLECAAALLTAGCKMFYVATLADAVRLDEGRLLPGIGVLGGLLPGEEETFASRAITPVLNDAGQMQRWHTHAVRTGDPLKAIIHFDTGMNRLGLTAADRALVEKHPEWGDGLTVTHVMTHMVASDDLDFELCHRQRALFLDAAKPILKRWPSALRSISNSCASFMGPDFTLDHHRPGKALYGMNPLTGLKNPMAIPGRVTAPLVQVKTVERGDPVGYSATWRATGPTRIGTVAIGYANGYPRHASNRGAVAIGGHRAPLVGRVSMDLLTVDVSAVPEPLLVPGAEVEITGDVITPAELAQAGGTSELALMIGLGKGCARRHTGGAAAAPSR